MLSFSFGFNTFSILCLTILNLYLDSVSRKLFFRKFPLTVKFLNALNEKKYKVYLTRDDDFFIPLDERVSKSRKLKANLFISVHADSAVDTETKGLSIYTLSENSSDKQAERLAQKENRSDIIGGADFSKTNDA